MQAQFNFTGKVSGDERRQSRAAPCAARTGHYSGDEAAP
jgi:hypothetical protein